MQEKEEIEKLQHFLIKKFILVILVVGIMEILIVQLMNQYLFPIIKWYFLKNLSEISITTNQFLIMVLVLFIELLIRILGLMVPFHERRGTDFIVITIENYINSKIPAMNGNQSLTQMNWLQVIFFLVIVVIMFMILLTPSVLGAFWFSVTTTKQVRKLEIQRNEEKAEYDRRRNLMISDIAHDLRTPITTISGYAKALADGMVKEEEKKQEYLNAMQIKSSRMNDLIQLLFEYVKLDSDGFQLNRSTFDLSELLRQNAAFIYSDIENAKMKFEIDIPEEKCMIYADNIQMSRVIINLLNNAIRHNEPGTCIFLSQRIENKKVYVTVADNGNPIEPEMAKHIFDPFYMGDESRNSKGGSGLGLSIAHKIMEMHGWKLELKNDIPGYTKAFYLEIS